MTQNIFSIHLVVEQIEAVSRLVLRLAIQLDLEFPDLTRCCQTHRQSPHLLSFPSTPEARALPSTGITRFHRYYGPLRRPVWPVSFPTPLEAPPPPVLGLPQLPRSLSSHAVLTTPVDRTGALVGCFPVRTAFPVSQAGRHPRLHFRGLLKLHSRYGLPGCSPTNRGLSHEASIRPVAQPNRSLATKSHRQLLGWVLPPPVICAVGAH